MSGITMSQSQPTREGVFHRLLTPFTIMVSFTDDALTFTQEGREPVSVPYRERPEVFGHPRFLMVDLDRSTALVMRALK